jgi:hypothetical protein
LSYKAAALVALCQLIDGQNWALYAVCWLLPQSQTPSAAQALQPATSERRQRCHYLLTVGRRVADLAGVIQADLGRLLVLALNGFVDFAPMDRYFAGRLDAESHFVAANVDDSYNDVIANNDALVALSGKHKHDATTAL